MQLDDRKAETTVSKTESATLKLAPANHADTPRTRGEWRRQRVRRNVGGCGINPGMSVDSADRRDTNRTQRKIGMLTSVRPDRRIQLTAPTPIPINRNPSKINFKIRLSRSKTRISTTASPRAPYIFGTRTLQHPIDGSLQSACPHPVFCKGRTNRDGGERSYRPNRDPR